MNGVEILSSEIIYNTFLPDWCIGLGVIFMMIFLICTLRSLGNDQYIATFIFFILTLGFMFLSGFGSMNNTNSVDYIKYKIIIDDSVSLTEFVNKYEILNQEDRIYTVKERE